MAYPAIIFKIFSKKIQYFKTYEFKKFAVSESMKVYQT